MGSSADEIAREIKRTRQDMEERILTLRERGEVAVERSRRAIVVAAAAGAAVGVLVIGGLVAYRLTRPPSTTERLQRVIPRRWWSRLDHLRDTLELGLRKQVPSMRLYVNDRAIGQEPPGSTFQKLAFRVATAAGTAIGGAIVQRLMARGEES